MIQLSAVSTTLRAKYLRYNPSKNAYEKKFTTILKKQSENGK